jgi:pimeloyl-ACP methyl ester carboxylesterase
MADFVPWSSQPFDAWAQRYAEGRLVELEGRRTHYIQKGEGPPLILLHGFFYDTFLWARNIDALSRHFTVYAYDLWGCGYSTREPLDYGYALYAEQLRLFMDAMGIPLAALMGQSMGAGTAIRFSLDHFERVDKLVLVSAAGMPNPLPIMARFLNLPIIGEFFVNLKTDAIRKFALKDLFLYDKSRVTDDYFERVTCSQKITGSIEAGLGIQRAEFFDKLEDEIRRLGEKALPTLLVWGRYDKAVPLRCGEQMQRLLMGSRLHVLEDAGHVSNDEKHEHFNAVALEFLLGSY